MALKFGKLRISGNNILTVVLVGLILMSVIQTAILWTGQNVGAQQTGQAVSMDTAAVIDELFQPYNLILSNGVSLTDLTEPRKVILNRTSENYSEIWSETVEYIKKAYNMKPEVLDKNEWMGLYSKKVFISEFKTNIRTDILAWFLRINKLSSGDMTGVYKVALSYNENTAGNMVLYILDDKELHKFTLPMISIGRDRYAEIMDSNMQTPGNSYRLPPSDIILQTRDDLLFNGTETNTFAKYSVITVQAPDVLKMAHPDSAAEQRNVANAVLSSERYSYETDLTKDGTLIIANLNNIYSLDDNGFMEYESKAATGETIARGAIKDAFLNAMKFIYENNRREMISKMNLYLSDIRDEKGSYTFVLNYRMSDNQMLPVFMDYYTSIGATRVKVGDAIRITATGSNVISATWLFRQLDRIVSSSDIDMRFSSSDINTVIDNKYANLFVGPDGFSIDLSEMQEKQTLVTDINLAYIINNIPRPNGIMPDWTIVTNLTKSRYIYEGGAN